MCAVTAGEVVRRRLQVVARGVGVRRSRAHRSRIVRSSSLWPALKRLPEKRPHLCLPGNLRPLGRFRADHVGEAWRLGELRGLA